MRGEIKFFAGVAIGIGIGAATDNLGVGIGIGIALGAALSQNKKKQEDIEPDSTEEDVVIDLNQMSRRKRKAKKDGEEWRTFFMKK